MDVRDLLSLKNKIVLITGGHGYFGSPMTEALAEAGAKVITASRSVEQAQKFADGMRAKGLDVHALFVDQANNSSVLDLRKRITLEYGRVDVFVNNAVLRTMQHYTDPLECFEQSMKVNATGMFDITREMAQLIAEGGGGAIVNIASMQGLFGPDFQLYEGTDLDSPPDYHFHKGGMITLTKYLARRLAPQNIRVNCISPGGIYVDQPEPFLSKYCAKVPLCRMAGTDDIKGAIVFLASNASQYITGINILIDGGLHC
jgi:NAD(P)-dependent dehydrogenase (short-subunit alcohol dehydrogenase family)